MHKYDFWVLWLAANATGTLLGTITFYIVALFLGFFGSPSLPGQQSNLEVAWNRVVGDFQAFMLFGALIGIMQWLVLRKYVAKSGFWFLTSAIAMFIGNAVSDVLPLFFHLRPIATELFLGWFFFGSISGLLQWMLLRKQVLYAGWWIAANTLAVTLAGVFFPSDLGLIGGCLGWAFSGVITGGSMFFLLQHPKTLDVVENVA